MKKPKDSTLILAINILTTLITIAFTLYQVEWSLVDSFLYLLWDMFLAFFRNLANISFIIYLGIEWCIKTPILYLLSSESDLSMKKKNAILGAVPFFGFFYGMCLKNKTST